MNEVIEKLLNEVDEDIREVMLLAGKGTLSEYKHWQLLPDPTNTILGWQAMRDRKIVNETKTNNARE